MSLKRVNRFGENKIVFDRGFYSPSLNNPATKIPFTFPPRKMVLLSHLPQISIHVLPRGDQWL
jgi:hypothetical protein